MFMSKAREILSLLGSPDFELTKDFKLSIIIKILKKHVH